jgi:hypothetical protein
MSAVQVASVEKPTAFDNPLAEVLETAEEEPWSRSRSSATSLRELARGEFESVFRYLEDSPEERRFAAVETELIRRVLRLGRVLIALFLALASERMEVPLHLKRGRKEFRRQPPKPRFVGTFFGKVRYWRVYMHQLTGRGGGFYPLDLRLGLTADGFSPGLLGRAVQLACKMSFSAAARVLSSFLGWAPATKSIEHAVLGFGAHTSAWFEQDEPPEEDGDVLVLQFDGKATPTATASELRKRRGKRSTKAPAPSPRHRGRDQRERRGRKKRRKKGDKSKNGRVVTLVTMYTLKRSQAADGSPLLLGPLNRKVYASYAPKRHAFAVARREADKRGFTADSGKLIQIVTDGDDDLAYYRAEFFPEAIHTLDVLHVVERLWEAAGCLFPEGSDELEKWVDRQKEHLYGGQIGQLLLDHETELQRLRKGRKRDRLSAILNYLTKRSHMMNYDELAAQDLELSSGMVEGAVRFVIGQRFDEGGMRWIRERAEALLQLRCVEINGDWERFVQFVQDRVCAEQGRRLRPTRVLLKKPKPLPLLGVAR